MPGIIDCFGKIGVDELTQKYILAKKDMYLKQGLDDNAASHRAIDEFKNETVENLADVYNQIADISGTEKPFVAKPKETDAIKTAIANADDVKAVIYRNILKEGNPEQVRDVLEAVSGQWHDEGTRSQTERDFGLPIVEAAKKMFPQETQKSLSVPQPAKPDVVGDVKEGDIKLNNGETVSIKLTDKTKEGDSFEIAINDKDGNEIANASFAQNKENGKYTPISVAITNDNYKGTNLLQGIYGFLKSKGAEIEGNTVKYSEATVARKNKQAAVIFTETTDRKISSQLLSDFLKTNDLEKARKSTLNYAKKIIGETHFEENLPKLNKLLDREISENKDLYANKQKQGVLSPIEDKSVYEKLRNKKFSDEGNRQATSQFIGKDGEVYYIKKTINEPKFEAFDKDLNPVGAVVFNDSKAFGENGFLTGYTHNQSIQVKPEFRRKGIATALTDFAEQVYKVPYKPSSLLSPEMQAFVDSRNKAKPQPAQPLVKQTEKNKTADVVGDVKEKKGATSIFSHIEGLGFERDKDADDVRYKKDGVTVGIVPFKLNKFNKGSNMLEKGEKGFTINIIAVEPSKRGKGEASKVLSEITKYADENGETIYLSANDATIGFKKGLSVKQLESWYERHGFKKDESIMVRKPQPAQPLVKEGEKGETKTKTEDVATKTISEKEVLDFHKKVDDVANSLIKALSAKLPPGTKKQGLGVEEIVKGAAAIIKKAYDVGTDIKAAIEEAVKYVKEQFKKEGLGDVDETVLRDHFSNKEFGEGIGITHAETAKLADKYGFTPYEKNPETVAKWDAEAAERIKNGEMPKLLDKMREGDEISAVEQRMMGQYIATLDSEVTKNPSNENLKRLEEALELSNVVGGRQAGKALVARKGIFLPDDSLGKALMDEKMSLGVEDLPESVKEQVIAEHKELVETQNKLVAALEENAKLQAELAAQTLVQKIRKSKSARQKKTPDDFQKERQTLKDKLKAQVEQYKATTRKMGIAPDGGVEGFKITVDMAKTIGQIVKSHAEEVTLKLDEIVNRVFDDVKDVLEGISKRDIVDVMAGVYNEKRPTRNEMAIRLRDLKAEAVLLKKIENERLGREPKTRAELTKKSQRLKELSDKVKEIRERNKDNTPVEKTDAERLADKRKSILKRISEIESDIKEGKFQRKEELPPVRLDKKTQALQDRLMELEHQQKVRREKDDYEKSSKWTKGWDKFWQFAELRRFVMAAIDFSVSFRQAAPVTFNVFKYLPKREDGKWKMNTAPLAFKNMFMLSFDPKGFKRFQYDLEKSEFGRMFMHFNGVFSNPLELRMLKREEEFANNIVRMLAQKIEEGKSEGLKKAAEIANIAWFSERAAGGLLNTIRIEEFTKGVKNLQRQGYSPENAPEQYKELVKWVMNMTGRGNMLESIEDSHAARLVANRAYFGARLMAAKINMLNPYYYAKMPKGLRVHVWKDVIGNVSTTIMIGLALRAAGASISFDEDDSDFLMVRFGDKVLDITGGSAGYIRTFIRALKAIGKQGAVQTKKLFGRNVSSSESKAAINYSKFAGRSVLKSLVANKLSPNTGYFYQAFTGKSGEYDESGRPKPFDADDIIEYYPMYVDGVREAFREGGLSPALLVLGCDVFGVGVQQYKDKEGGSGQGGGASSDLKIAPLKELKLELKR